MNRSDYPGLSAARMEALIHLMEECAEVTKAAAKMGRHGPDSHHPDHPSTDNREDLGREIGNLRVAIEMVMQLGLVFQGDVLDGAEEKWALAEKFLHHIDVDPATRTARAKP